MSSFKTNTRHCRTYLEESPGQLNGTIIDIETIGEFSECVGLGLYKQIRPIVVGFLDCNSIEILYITKETRRDFDALRSVLRRKMCRVKHPLYAFNAEFEMGVLYWFLGRPVMFDRDLMFSMNTPYGESVWESKRYLVKDLGIPNFDDPFHDMGFRVPEAWEDFQRSGNVEFLKEIIIHNRACLLKEYTILKKRRRWRKVDKTIIEAVSKVK